MFKLINFFGVHQLNHLRDAMGASVADDFNGERKLTLLDDEAIRKLGVEGIDVDFDDIQPQKNKTLGYKGQRVLVYIRDVSNYRDESEVNLPKFHISYCKTLERMRSAGRWQRYVVANKDDGFFHIRINKRNPEFKELNVCQLCLENLHWNGFSRSFMSTEKRRDAVINFSIAEFFLKFPKSLFSITPVHTSDTAPINDYSENWREISEKLKLEKDYECEIISCRIRLLNGDRKFIHVHHINGLKNDNSKSNLKVLCIRCHANELGHAHMKSHKDYKEFIEKYD